MSHVRGWLWWGVFGAILAVMGSGRAVAGPVPIALTGWNADVVSDADPLTRFAQRFDLGTVGRPNSAAWYETGAGGRPDGLPSGQDFTSAVLNPITGDHTIFHLQPANALNVLRLGDTDPITNTLTLVQPAAFTSLSILASSGAAFGPAIGNLVLNFTDGTSSLPLSYNAFDWFQLTPGAAPFIALGSRGRNGDIGADGKGFAYLDASVFALYETDLDLAALGLADRELLSITFNRPATIGGITTIFAVSGAGPAVIPEPGSLALFAAGALGLFLRRWRANRA
jgi:hypothetical protein